MALSNFLSKITAPVVKYVNEIPERTMHDVGVVNDFSSEVSARVNNDVKSVSHAVADVSQGVSDAITSDDTAPEASDDIFGDQDGGDAVNTPVGGDVTDPDDIYDDQETGNPDGNGNTDDDIFGDQDFGDADNEVDHGEVTDPDDIFGGQDVGRPGGEGPVRPASDPAIGAVVVSGAAADDGQITFDEKGEQIQLGVTVSGIADGASADVEMVIDGVTYAAALVDGVWVANVPASGLLEGEIDGSVNVSVKDIDGTTSYVSSDFSTGIVVDFSEPVEQSAPVIGDVSLGGIAASDGEITFDEQSSTVYVDVEVTGLAAGASTDVSVEIDGASYDATFADGFWTAAIPVSALSEGEVVGSVAVTVTDANGQVSTTAQDFQSGVTVDFTEPAAVSDPVIGDVSLGGVAASDGEITFDEKNATVYVDVEVTGLAAGASTDVSVEIDGASYDATFADGFWTAAIPVSALSEGEVVGSVAVTVTDANGHVSAAAQDFNSGVTVDFTEPAPASDPVIDGVSLVGAAAADGEITFEEKGETVQVEIAVSGIAEGATANVTVDIANSTYAAALVDGVWVADVPVENLPDGEVTGRATVSVIDPDGDVFTETSTFSSGVVVDLVDHSPASNPQIGEVSFGGAAVADGEITHDEKGETIEVRFEVSGIHPEATAEVNVSVDGASYAAVNDDGVWVAKVPAKNLNEGVLSGAVSVKVTDTNGAVTTDADSFNSSIVVDYAEPTSDPSIDAITFEGEIFDDNTLTSDELDESFQVRVEVSGAVDGAQTEVTLDVDGVTYETVFENGAFYADVPATELQDGHLNGTATVAVTDPGGQVSTVSDGFNTSIATDLVAEEFDPVAHEDQSTGTVEMDLDSMITYTSGEGLLGVESDFNITLNFGDNGVSNELKASAIQMAEYISTLFTEDLEGFNSYMTHGQVGSTVFSEVAVDDYLINVNEEYIDGLGGVHAGANSSVQREDGPDAGLFTRGSITMDTADMAETIAEGAFNDMILHEMMHALGFGDWSKELVPTDQTYGGHFRFTGENAIAAYHAQHPDLADGDTYADMGVPVEAEHGFGNAAVHWDHQTFDGTQGGLMSAGVSGYYYGSVDAMTLASMEDMGYETVWDASAPGEQPHDYDFLPEVVQDPDLVNKPSDDIMMMAEVDDTAEDDLLFSANVDEDGDADQADAGAIPADDDHTGINDLLMALLGGAPAQDETSEDEASLFADLDTIIFGRDAPAEDAGIFEGGSDADTASAEGGFYAGGHGESHFEVAQVASFDLQLDDHLMG